MLKRFRPVIRIFVSSTFSDLTAERNTLEQHVWPVLSQFCQKQGFQFQAIDLRWGVSTEAGLDHRTMRICLDELKRSQEVSPQPNFLILLGDRYGWRPLPEEISADEFRQLWVACSDDHERSTLRTWYRADENAIPVKHLLRSRRDSPDGCDYTLDPQHRDREEWSLVQATLWRLINRAFPVERLESRFAGPVTSGTTIPEIVRFQASATEQEIWAGALSIPGASEHVVTVSREITNLTDWLEHPEAARFMNMTDNGELDLLLLMELGSLRLELRDLLGENYVEVPQPVVLKEVSESRPGSRLQVSADHLEFLCRSVRERFERLIQRQIDEYNSVVGTTAAGLTPELLRSLQRENDEHARFAAERAPEGSFLGRQDELKRIRDYIDDRRAADDSHAMPFVLAGPSGSGKSAVMAAAAREARNRSANFLGGAIVIERYLGTTRHSSDVRSLLTDVCCCLRQHFPLETPLPADIRLLGKEFYAQLENANAFAPIVILLDALDQLDSAEDALRLWWIRSTPLPEGVRMIVSCATDDENAADAHPWEILNQRGFVRAGNSYLVEELEIVDAKNLWNTWMAAAGRSLTVSQQAVVDARVVRGPGACRQPLYLRVLFEEARQWYSWHQPLVPAQTVNELLMQVLERLCLPERHGPLVEPALSCLVAAKYGLTENELLEILFRDREYKSEFMQSAFHKLPEGADRVPIAIWSGLRHDLAPYLTERGAPGGVVLQFFHRQVANAVRGLFTRNSEQKARRHRQLILYFARQHWWLEPRSEQRKRMSPPYSARPVNVRKVTELPEHLIQLVRSAQLANSEFDTACRWLEKTFQNIKFLEAKNESGRVFELAEEFSRAILTLPDSRLARQTLRLLEEALRRDIHFIDRHSSDYPQGLFQCLWNSCSACHAETQFPTGELRVRSEPPTKSSIRHRLDRWRDEMSGRYAPAPWLRTVVSQAIALAAGQRAVLHGHERGVTTVACLPDGSRIVSGSRDGTVRIWDAASGRLEAVLRGHERSVTSICCFPSGSRIVSGSEDGTVRIWDVTTGRQEAVLRGHEDGATSVCCTPDSSRIVSGSRDATVRIWEVATGYQQSILRGHERSVTSVCCLPDGARIVSGSEDGTLRIWNVATGFEHAVLRGSEAFVRVTCVASSPHGDMMLTGSSDGFIRIWCLATLRVTKLLRVHNGVVTGLSCSMSHGKIVGVSQDAGVRVWNVEDNLTGRSIWDAVDTSDSVFLEQESSVNCVAWLPDSSQFVIGMEDSSIRLWDGAVNNEIISPTFHKEQIWQVAWSPDLTKVASAANDASVAIWDATTGALLYNLQGHRGSVWSIAWSPNATQLATGSADRTVRTWDVSKGKENFVLKNAHDGGVRVVAFSPDGAHLVSGAEDHLLRVWDARTGRFRTSLRGHEGPVTCVTFSPDETKIATGAWDRTVRLFRLPPNPHSGSSGSFFSRVVSLFTSFFRAGIHSVLRGHEDTVWSVRFAPDGKRIISCSGDGTIHIWDSEMLQSRGTLHHFSVTNIACSSDSRRYASYSENCRSALLWDADSLKCLKRIDRCNDIEAIVAGPEKHQLLAIVRKEETVIEDVVNDRVVAVFPVAADSMLAGGDGRRWAGSHQNRFFLTQLEEYICRPLGSTATT